MSVFFSWSSLFQQPLLSYNQNQSLNPDSGLVCAFLYLLVCFKWGLTLTTVCFFPSWSGGHRCSSPCLAYLTFLNVSLHPSKLAHLHRGSTAVIWIILWKVSGGLPCIPCHPAEMQETDHLNPGPTRSAFGFPSSLKDQDPIRMSSLNIVEAKPKDPVVCNTS